MGDQPPPVVLFLDRNRMQFYHEGMGNIVGLDVSEQVLKDLMVTSQAAFSVLVRDFCRQQKIDPAPLIILMAEAVYFEKIFPNQEDAQSKSQQFFDEIPFNFVQKKVYEIGKETRAIAINKDLLDALVGTFEGLGFRVDLILPVGLLGSVGIKRWMDLPLAQYALKNFAVLRRWSLLPGEDLKKNRGGKEIFFAPRQKSLTWTLPIFIVLILILIILLLRR